MNKTLSIPVVIIFIYSVLKAVNTSDLTTYSRQKRVIGGSDIAIKYIPYHASVELNNSYHCGGTIIDEYWIITAAHCITESINFYRIRTGSSVTTIGGTIHTIQTIIKHHRYYADINNHQHNDIALILINERIIFDILHQPIQLFDYNEIISNNSIGIASGYGSSENKLTIKKLQIVCLQIIPKEQCDVYYESQCGIPENQFCAASSKSGRDTCSGDSGGPLVINGRLGGIVSWSIGCAVYSIPGVYTEIAPYRLWIDKIISQSKSLMYSDNYKLHV